MFYWTAYIFLKILSKIICPCRIYGAENIPSKGGFIFASNHLSNLDPILIGICCKRRLSYAAKESLFKNKIFSYIIKNGGAFPIRRNSSDVRALREALRRLQRGCPIVVFPEGSRKTAVFDESEIRPGVGFLAVKSRVPIIPVFIKDSEKVLPKGSRFFKYHPITIYFGKPLWYSNQDAYTGIADQIMKEIGTLSSRLVSS